MGALQCPLLVKKVYIVGCVIMPGKYWKITRDDQLAGGNVRMEAPASRFHPVLQRFQKSMCLVQLSKSGKYASDKKVAQNTLIIGNVEAPSARLFHCNVFIATLQYSNVF